MKIPFLKYQTGELNIADWVSFYRIVMTPVLFLLIFFSSKLVFAIFLAISMFSDALDGFLARKLKIVTKRGASLDSIGDMMTVIVAVVGIILLEPVFVKEHIVLLSIGVGLYLLQLGIAYWKYGKPSSFHTYSAKVAFFLQAIFFLGLFFFGYWPWLFYVAIILTILEAIEEIVLIFVLKKWKTNVGGLFWVFKSKNK